MLVTRFYYISNIISVKVWEHCSKVQTLHRYLLKANMEQANNL